MVITNWWGVAFIVVVINLVYAMLIATGYHERKQAKALRELRIRQANRRR